MGIKDTVDWQLNANSEFPRGLVLAEKTELLTFYTLANFLSSVNTKENPKYTRENGSNILYNMPERFAQ